MTNDATYWIKRFNMTTHVEGGSFSEAYRSPVVIPAGTVAGFGAERNIATHIYFLLEQGQFSAFHRIRSDELWHFYDGEPLIVYEIDLEGKLTEHRLGLTPDAVPYTVIRAGSWFASAPDERSSYALVGCTVSPGFDFDDFELAKKATLAAMYPPYTELIKRLSKD